MLNLSNRYLWKFAWKSIGRNRGRSFFIGLSVSIAVVIAIWVIAFFDGLNAQIERAVVNTNTGFYQIQEQNFAQSTDSSSPVELSSDLAAKFTKPFIKAISPELVLDGNISTPEGAASLLVLGIVPDFHAKVLPVNQHIVEGHFIRSDDQFCAVIGKELADLFKFKTGDQFVLNYQDKLGELRSEILNICGIYRYNSRSFEKRFIYVNQNTWQQLYLNETHSKILFNRITILTPKLGFKNQLKNLIKNENLMIKSWKDLNPEMAVVLEFHDGMISFFLLIIAVTITMTILTPVRMLWQERFKEIKMMNTLGVSSVHLWKLGTFEAIQMILLAGIFSILVLGIIIGYQSYAGVDFRFLNDGIAIERAGIKLPGIIYPLLSFHQLIITFIFVFLVLGSSYLWSIYRTLKRLEDQV